MKVKDFYYDLPGELIAQTPIPDRSSSRLLALSQKTGEISHETFKDIKKYLKVGDALVINDSKVIPARIFGKRETGAEVECLLLSEKDKKVWEMLVKPGKKARPGDRLVFAGGRASCEILEIIDEGIRIAEFQYDGDFFALLDEIGSMPLPPYIHEQLKEKDRYQTVYAGVEGSAAAPTAGLHFTHELLKEIEDMGVKVVRLTLHVGLGTFRPVKEKTVEAHKMHAESYYISRKAAESINLVKAAGGSIVAVGTTSCRTLEAAADEAGHIRPGSGKTDIFIYPGYRFKITDRLITNFHLPESTLLMLVSAMAGKENIMAAYEEAVKERYRFFSFGDAMIIY